MGKASGKNSFTNDKILRIVAGKKGLVSVIIIITILIVAITIFIKSPYHIAVPKDSNFNLESVTYLPNKEIELIREYIPKVTKWYNSIDISKEQPLDFVSNEVDELGNRLYDSEIWNTFIESYGNVKMEDKLAFDQIDAATNIHYSIAKIMMQSNIEFAIPSEPQYEEETVMMVEEDSWIELGDKIRKAIEYYY